MDDKETIELLDRILAPWVRELALTPVKADAELFDETGNMAVHATTTYALLE